jgi:uncharacterized protein
MAQFKLHLSQDGNSRSLIYQTDGSLLFWEDTGEMMDLQPILRRYENSSWQTVEPISPQVPGVKNHDLQIIKVQMGFACNMACKYCSQNNLRAHATLREKGLSRAQRFIENIPRWFSGGKSGDGDGAKLEFWGGETLLYWPEVRFLTEKLRDLYPKLQLGLITNGTLIKDEMISFAAEHQLHFVISHDGPGFNEARGRDPLRHSPSRESIRRLFQKLNPLGLVSFNATVTNKNFSLKKIRRHIAEGIEVPETDVLLTMDLMTPYDQQGMQYVISEEERQQIQEEVFYELATLSPRDLHLGQLSKRLGQFFSSLAGAQPLSSVGQMCEMDLPSSLAVDLDGNVLTCQNTTTSGGHRIGKVEQLEDVRLTTSYHWSHRQECPQCPVVHLCRGSCMFLKDDLWKSACQQHFHWNTILFAVALYHLTGAVLTKIEGQNIRGDKNVPSIDVMNSRVLSQRFKESQNELR